VATSCRLLWRDNHYRIVFLLFIESNPELSQCLRLLVNTMDWPTVPKISFDCVSPMVRPKIRFVVPITLTGILLAFTHVLWLPGIGRFLIVADPLQPTDALVPLAGDRDRIRHAAELFRQGYARTFILTEMWIGVRDPKPSYADMVTWQAIAEGVVRERIQVAPGMAATTYAEALNLRRMAQEQRWQSLLVVTSPYHTRRARMILRDAFRDTNIHVIVRPTQPGWYTAQTWWQSRRGFTATAAEYLKLALYLVGFHRIYKG
jgi:uncharacterized SAM-binding protein YcdF (DUF218 family)